MMDRLSAEMRRIAQAAPVIPVLTIARVEDAAPLAEALVRGGLPVLEITLRTDAALDAIAAAKAAVPEAIVGAGTILSAADMRAARDHGAVFGVSPGATDAILDAAIASETPFLPGAGTASEAMRLAERGFSMAKLFPAGPSGGVAMLKSLASPLTQIAWCPTGGVGPSNAADYLALPNVLCVGGSWVSPEDAVEARDWSRIEALAREAAGLRAA